MKHHHWHHHRHHRPFRPDGWGFRPHRFGYRGYRRRGFGCLGFVAMALLFMIFLGKSWFGWMLFGFIMLTVFNALRHSNPRPYDWDDGDDDFMNPMYTDDKRKNGDPAEKRKRNIRTINGRDYEIIDDEDENIYHV